MGFFAQSSFSPKPWDIQLSGQKQNPLESNFKSATIVSESGKKEPTIKQ